MAEKYFECEYCDFKVKYDDADPNYEALAREKFEAHGDHIEARVKKLSEWTDAEKIKIFDKLYGFALDDLKYLEKNGYEPNDSDHYTWEEVMKLLGDNVFDIWNELC